MTIKQFFHEIIPRFHIDYVAGYMDEAEGEFYPECSMEHWDDDVPPHTIVKVKVFSWLCFSFPTEMGEIIDLDDYWSETE